MGKGYVRAMGAFLTNDAAMDRARRRLVITEAGVRSRK